MFNQLLAEQSSFFGTYGLLLIMIAFIAILIVFSTTKRKKDAKMADEFVNSLKVGDKIKTYSGIYGTILSLKEQKDGSKIAVIETGEGNTKTTMTIDLFAIYSIVKPTSDANAKGIELLPPEEKENEIDNSASEEPIQEESVEINVQEELPKATKRNKKEKSELDNLQ